MSHKYAFLKLRTSTLLAAAKTANKRLINRIRYGWFGASKNISGIVSNFKLSLASDTVIHPALLIKSPKVSTNKKSEIILI